MFHLFLIQLSFKGIFLSQKNALLLIISIVSQKKQGNSIKTSTFAIDYAKAFDCEDHNKLENS